MVSEKQHREFVTPVTVFRDLAGRVFAPSLEVPGDLAGAAGAAGGISGGYHLPFTAMRWFSAKVALGSRC